MYIQSYLKNSYIDSNRNFSDDYANTESKKIDMTLSGIYLYKYPKFDFNPKQLCLYPSKYRAIDLINLIRKKNRIKNSIVLGPGSNGILQNIIKVVMNKGDNLVTPFYSFNQAEYAATSLGCITRRAKCDNYNISIENIKQSIDKNTKIVYICNPNNPTGIYMPVEKILNFAKSVDNIVIVDESSIEFSDNKSILEFKKLPPNLIVLRSFSKAFGLANMRIGYMICSPEFEKYYIDNTTINEYSGLSIEFAIKMLNNYDYVLKNIEMIKDEKIKLNTSLENLGIKTISSDSNTIMSETTFDEQLIEELFNNDISVIKIYDEFNKIHFRIAVQDKISNKKFIDKLKNIMGNGDVNE